METYNCIFCEELIREDEAYIGILPEDVQAHYACKECKDALVDPLPVSIIPPPPEKKAR